MGFSTPSSRSITRGFDIHHHFIPPFYLDALTQAGHPAAIQAEALAWSPEKSVAMMDESKIKTAIVSLSLPGTSFTGAADPAALARQCNEYAARMISDHPGRFGAFASLPMLDAEAAISEIEYAFDTLKLNGVMLLSNIQGHYLGESNFDAILSEINHRKTTVFLHPNQAPSPGYNDFVEFPHDITRALASLTESGALERCPRIRYILAYGGGTIPFIASRVTVVGMDVFGSLMKTMKRYFKRVRIMQRMNYDLAAATDPFAWRALTGHTRPTRILLGSNYPWTPASYIEKVNNKLCDFNGFNKQDLIAITHQNALKLFPRFGIPV